MGEGLLSGSGGCISGLWSAELTQSPAWDSDAVAATRPGLLLQPLLQLNLVTLRHLLQLCSRSFPKDEIWSNIDKLAS